MVDNEWGDAEIAIYRAAEEGGVGVGPYDDVVDEGVLSEIALEVNLRCGRIEA